MKIKLSEKIEMFFNDGYQRVGSLPEDPPNSIPLMCQTSQSMNMILLFAIPKEQSMPFDNPQEVIDGIHSSLEEDQGLIEVKTGTTKSGFKFIYSIVKTLDSQNPGVQYFMLLQIELNDFVLNIQGFFSEIGTTGIRDSIIFASMREEGKVKIGQNSKDIIGWNKDPYDENYTKGALMNLSEKEVFDKAFPEHPLSQARMFIEESVKEL